MTVIFAALSALLWGSGDFLGGSAAQRSSPVPATLVSSAVGFLVTGVAAAIFIDGDPSGADLALGAVSGAFVGFALLAFYAAMSMGKMSIVAPVSALTSASVPVIVGLVGGDSLSLVGWIAVLGGFIGIALVSTDSDSQPGAVGGNVRSRATNGVILSLAAGIGFGAYLAVIAQTSSASGLWPLLASRGTSLMCLMGVAAATSQLRLPRPAVRESAAAGVFDAFGNTMYVASTRYGNLAVAGTIASMYPASTVALAAIVHHERPNRLQAMGIVTLLIAVIVLASPLV